MPKQHPRYGIDVQRQAVEQVLTQQRSIAQVARKFRCSTQSIQRWIKQHGQSFMTSDIASSTSSLSHATFLPLQVDTLSMVSSATIELVTKKGLTLRFPVDTSTDILCDIVRRLEATPC